MCTRSQPTGPSAVGARHVKERPPSRETVTVLRLARHPARQQGVRCMHCRTHPSLLWDCLPVHQFTVPSEPLPYACCGCTCQQPHAGPGWASSPPSPASSSPAGLGVPNIAH